MSRKTEYCEGCQIEMSEDEAEEGRIIYGRSVCSDLCLRVVEEYEEWDEICGE